jgi:hypothetical protein
VAEYIADDNYVDDNKRECATNFLNHLIELGVMTLDGQRRMAGDAENGILESACISWQHIEICFIITNFGSGGSHFRVLEVAGYVDILPPFGESSTASTCISAIGTSM